MTKLLANVTLASAKLTLIASLVVSCQAISDTTNRALQITPQPGIFVGGVGLLCELEQSSLGILDEKKFIVLTRDREKMGIALFDNDDVSYQFLPLLTTTLDEYQYLEGEMSVSVNRKDLRTAVGEQAPTPYRCEVNSVSDLHKAAEQYLRERLSENKI